MQMDLFNQPSEESSNEIKEVRSHAQEGRKISYDVGKKIGGAKKDLAKLKEYFRQHHDDQTLDTLENNDTASAIELITKEELFGDFSYESQKDNGVDASIAKFKYLMIRRIKSVPGDSQQERQGYLKAARILKKEMKKLKKREDLQTFINRIGDLIKDDFHANTRDRLEERLVSLSETHMHMEKNHPRLQMIEKEILKIKNNLERANKAIPISTLGPSFISLFTKQSSLRSSIKNINGVTWDELLQSKKGKDKGTKKRKLKWERYIPERPDRVGGQDVSFEVPEEMVQAFKLKGLQFGHYVEDSKAIEHICRSSEAMFDLADILRVSPEFLSLDGELSLAFGARGSGKALGHYEPLYRIINFTKNKGTLGILAHEWMHALDHHLATRESDKHLSYLSDDKSLMYDWVPYEVRITMSSLMESIKKGLSYETYRLPVKAFRLERMAQHKVNELFNETFTDGVLNKKQFSCLAFEFVEQRKNERLNTYTSLGDAPHGMIERINDQSAKMYENMLRYASILYNEATGETLSDMPKVVLKSRFYTNAKKLDGKGKAYYTTNRELLARAFESYIDDKLTQSNRKNDYLVSCTADPLAFPQDEERQKIHEAFDTFFEAVRGYLVD